MPYIQNRVYVADYGSLPKDSPLLAQVPTAPGHVQQFLHRAAAERFTRLSAAAEKDLGSPLLVASGRRDPLWETEEDYERDMIKQYGSVEKGKKFRAFASAHQTGLAADLGCGGLAPISATIDKQRKTRLFRWLVENMWRYGWTPYLPEPWHIECKIPLEEYHCGVISPAPAASLLISQDDSVCEDGACFSALSA